MPPAIFVRALSEAEVLLMSGVAVQGYDLERYGSIERRVILLSHRGFTPLTIARLEGVGDQRVRRLIRRFNALGLDGLLDGRRRSGRRRRVSEEWEAAILRVAAHSCELYVYGRDGRLVCLCDTLSTMRAKLEALDVRVTERQVRYYLAKHGFFNVDGRCFSEIRGITAEIHPHQLETVVNSLSSVGPGRVSPRLVKYLLPNYVE